MRGLAGFGRRLDRSQHARRKIALHPPMVMQEMLGDASNAHVCHYQLPEAPPPPKLPPPPPLSLELLLLLELESLLHELPEPLSLLRPPPRLLPPPEGAAKSTNSAMTKMTNPARIAIDTNPMKNHASTPTMPPVAIEPISLPSVVRRMPPTTNSAKRRKGLSGLR